MFPPLCHRCCYLKRVETHVCRYMTCNFCLLGWFADGFMMCQLVDEHNLNCRPRPRPVPGDRGGYQTLTDFKIVLKPPAIPRSLSVQSIQSDMQRRKGKIDQAVMASMALLDAMMGPQDRCTVVGFNDNYSMFCDLANEDTAKVCLAVMTQCCQSSTYLYDATILSVVHFISQADSSRPWVLLIITDGNDSGSGKSLQEAAAVLQRYNAAQNNFAFIVGIGSDVNKTAMENLARSGGGVYIPVEDAAILFLIFAAIAVQIEEGVQVDIASVRQEGVEAVLARVQRTRTVSKKAIDMLILMDISGSMTSR